MYKRERKMFQEIIMLFLTIQVQLPTEEALKQKTFLNLFMVELKLFCMEHGIILRVMYLQN